MSEREARSPSGNTCWEGTSKGRNSRGRSSKRGEVVAGAAVKSTAKRKTGVGIAVGEARGELFSRKDRTGRS